MKKVEVGQEFKNYKMLCAYLDEPVKGGKSKQLQDKEWNRHFTYHKEGNRIIIDKVYEEPLEKEERTSNNTKNIKPLMDYMRGNSTISMCEYYTLSHWYCDELKLLDDIMCGIIYQKEADIKEYCEIKNISTEHIHLLCDYVSVAKSVLKDMFLKSLRHMEKKNLVKYTDGQMFKFRASMTCDAIGHVETERLNNIINKNETAICDNMNREHNLSEKMKGRQLLMIIYGKEELKKEFDAEKLEMLMDNRPAMKLLNLLSDEIRSEEYKGEVEIEKKNHPLINYYRGIYIKEMDYIEGIDIKPLGIEVCNIIRKKTRKQIFNKKYKNKNSNKITYPNRTPDIAQDIIKIENILFKFYDETFDDETGINLLATDTELFDLEFGNRQKDVYIHYCGNIGED